MRDNMMRAANKLLQEKLMVRLNTIPVYKTLPYKSVNAARRKNDPCIKFWPKLGDHVAYELQMLKKQEYRCAITGMVMSDTTESESRNRPFAPSLDAIDPTEGHIPGNTRWICSFLNSSNNDKQKTQCFTDDAPTAWTSERWKQYLYGDAYIKFKLSIK